MAEDSMEMGRGSQTVEDAADEVTFRLKTLTS